MKKCPVNKFKKCIGEECAWSLKCKDGNTECAVFSAGHIDFTLAAIGAILNKTNTQGEQK